MGAESYKEGDIPGREGGGQASEQAQEQFRENLRKAQAAQKQAAIVEDRFRTFDNTLAAIIRDLLQKGGYDRIIALIIALVEADVPSDFILAVLSILDERAQAQARIKIETSGGKTYDLALVFESAIKSKIYNWINTIYSCAIIDKEKVLGSVINYNTWECLPAVHLLFFEILTIILDEEKIEYDRAEQKEFAKGIFDKMMDKLQTEMYT